MTSSMTAAPRMTVASGEDICPASIRVRAEMETLVAVSAPPIKQAVLPGEAKQMSDAGTQQEGPNDSEESDQKGGAAGLAHAVNVGLKAGDEHQHQSAELRHEHECAGRFAAGEEVEVQQIDRARAEHHADHQLAENGRDREASCTASRRS